tara:strand:+ start:8793 stop:8975 length:183 start_codon:yes stop_codon:yes gene_type:complete
MAKTLMTSGKKYRMPRMSDLDANQRKLANHLMRAGVSKRSAVLEAIQEIDPLNHKAFDLY